MGWHPPQPAGLAAGLLDLALEVSVLQRSGCVVATLGVTAYRTGFGRPKSELGPQDRALAGSSVCVLPNPSGLNAHHQLDDLIRRFSELRTASRMH